MPVPLPGMGWGFGGGAMAFSSIFSAEKIKQQPESSGFPGRCRPGRMGSRTGSGTGSVPPAPSIPKGGQRPSAPAQRLGKLEAGACRQAARAGGCQLCLLPARPDRDGTPGPIQSARVPGRPRGSQGKEQSWTRPPTTRGERRLHGFQAPVSLMNANIYHLHVKVRFFSFLFRE